MEKILIMAAAGAAGGLLGVFVARLFRLSGRTAQVTAGVMAAVAIAIGRWAVNDYQDVAAKRELEAVMDSMPVYGVIDEHYPQVSQRMRADAAAQIEAGADALAVANAIRTHNAGLVARQMPLANTDIAYRMLRLGRDQVAAAGEYSADACAEVALGSAFSFDPLATPMGRHADAELALTTELLRQTATDPQPRVAPLSEAEQQRIADAAFARIPAEHRAGVMEALQHPDEILRTDRTTSFCRWTIAWLDTLLEMPPEEAARVFKAMRDTPPAG